jgi:hypothetical protein
VKNLTTFITVSTLLILFSVSAFGQKATRIKFARGTTSAVITGKVSSFRGKRLFVIRVRPGETLKTEQVGNSHQITIYVTDPTGEDVGDSDASCNNRREIAPTLAGDYRITVVGCQKADPWRGRYRFRVTVR